MEQFKIDIVDAEGRTGASDLRELHNAYYNDARRTVETNLISYEGAPVCAVVLVRELPEDGYCAHDEVFSVEATKESTIVEAYEVKTMKDYRELMASFDARFLGDDVDFSV